MEKTQCAIVLLHSLPCARHAVLEQLCDVFHEAVQKYVVEFERQALSGEFYFYSYISASQKICIQMIAISVFVDDVVVVFFFFRGGIFCIDTSIIHRSGVLLRATKMVNFEQMLYVKSLKYNAIDLICSRKTVCDCGLQLA